MKETVKISIGGLAFILDQDAYIKLNNYLDALKEYYQNKEDGIEITKDIESRIADLLQIQTTNTERIINIDDINYIIKIIGNPDDLTEDDDAETKIKSNSDTKKDKKKLYRDLDNKIFGGVCGGLGQYFKTDPIIIRIVAILLVFSGNYIYNKLSLYTIVLYFILWAIVPAAKSVQQKIAMLNKSFSLDELETRKIKRKELHGAKLGQILIKTLSIILGIILFIIGIALIFIPFILVFSTYIIGIPSIGDIAETFGLGFYNINISLFLILIIPALVLLFVSIRLFTKFKKRDLKVIGIGVLIWFASLTFFAKPTATKIKEFKVKAEQSKEFIIDQKYDTLFVSIDKLYNSANPIIPVAPLYVSSDKPFSWFILPKITVIKDENFKDLKIKIEKLAWSKNYAEANKLALEFDKTVSKNDSLLMLRPNVFTKQHNYNGQHYNISIYAPLNKEIIIREPIYMWLEIQNDSNNKKYHNQFAYTFKF